MRSALNSKGQMYQAFPLGGVIRALTVNEATWTEFDPQGGDLYAIQVPPISGGRVVFTSSRTFTDLANGDEVTPLHLQRAFDMYPGYQENVFDRDREDPTRFFFAVADVVEPTSVDLLFMRAAD